MQTPDTFVQEFGEPCIFYAKGWCCTVPFMVRIGKSRGDAHGETRKIAAILVADVVGYSRLAGAGRGRDVGAAAGVRGEIDQPASPRIIGRIVERHRRRLIIEFRSVVDAVRCAIEVQRGMAERNAGVAPDRRIEFRIGVHLGDVVEEADGDLMGEGSTSPRGSRASPRRARSASPRTLPAGQGRLDLAVADLGPQA